MGLSDYLKWQETQTPDIGGTAKTEYRLLCSGALHPANVQGDWRRSDGARLLMHEPFELIVVSRPYDDYPQELALRYVHPSSGMDHHRFATELSGILTLLNRRFVTPYVMTRTVFNGDGRPELQMPPWMNDWSRPFCAAVARVWERRPMIHKTTRDGVEWESFDVPPAEFNAELVAKVLRAIRSSEVNGWIVRVAQLYSSAFAQIEFQPEVAYQSLISCVEAMANVAFKDWKPERDEILQEQEYQVFRKKAKELAQLTDDVADELTLEAARLKEYWWVTRKFCRFLLDYADWQSLEQPDDLFIVPDDCIPAMNSKESKEKVLKRIYRQRSYSTHNASLYPVSASIGTSPLIPHEVVMQSFEDTEPFPPVGWFERVVGSSARRYIHTLTSNAEQ